MRLDLSHFAPFTISIRAQDDKPTKGYALDAALNKFSPYTFEFLCLGMAWYATTQLSLDLARRRWRRRYKEEVERREKAETANKAKAFFLTSMSHEVRAPLNAIVGFTELALRSPLSSDLRAYLGTIRASADWLSHVANEILDHARMEAGSMELKSDWFSLREVLSSAVNIADPLAAKKKLRLRLHLDPGLPARVQGDSTRLLQVLYNLIENAIKFTTTGSVLVTALVHERNPDSLTCRISVADTGSGIAPERLNHLFEPLARPAESLDRRNRTCGFGLPICHRLVNMMGGAIDVQSHPGIGSTFSFLLTFDTKKKETPKRPGSRFPGRRIHVLVADDNAASRMLSTVLLQGAGHQVTEAANGLEALKLFTAGNFDLVLMDIEMPELNGIEATKAIRATEPAGKRTPIYALTSHASQSDEETCLKAGMTGFLTKPLSVDKLLELAAGIGEVGDTQAYEDPVIHA